MLATIPIRWSASWPALVALGMVVLAGLAVYVRRPNLPRAALGFAAGGMAMLILAIAQVSLLLPSAGRVTVMVDLSPSTRTADYRNRATLNHRIDELLGDTPHRIIFFAQTNRTTDVEGDVLPDLPADHTVFSPPSDGPVLLFSDGRFAPPAFAPPTFAALDAALDHPNQASVARLELRGRDVTATILNRGKTRQLNLSGVIGSNPIAIEGDQFITRPLAEGATQVVATLSGKDAWPENKTLSLIVPPPMATEKWWIGSTSPGSDWRLLSPDNLPADPARYLAASIVVLDNIPATSLGPAQQDRLVQYVRDLGGSLVVLGGDHAFAAGGYANSKLETILPLASTPPRAAEHWMLLADASGSMNDATGGAGSPTKWKMASAAIVSILPSLPGEDLVSVGYFADDLHWWVSLQSVRRVLRSDGNLPPADFQPHGGTNLQAAIRSIADKADGASPTQLLVVTDADTIIDQPDALAAALNEKKIHFHLLAIEEGRALSALGQIATATQGSLQRELDPAKWTKAAQELLQSALPDRLIRQSVSVEYSDELEELPARDVTPWDRTWIKNGARLLAEATYEDESVPMAALWQAGSGQAAAFAYAPEPAVMTWLVDHIARQPRDPRFQVTWDAGSPLRVIVDASDNGKFLDDQSLVLEIAEQGHSSRRIDVPQTAPGRYEATLPAPRESAFLTLRNGDRIIDRTVVAGRYPEEFDAIGNDIDALDNLAARTGGQVILSSQHGRIDLKWPTRLVPLESWLAAAGALLIAVALGIWRKYV